jgi:choline dehydrogenase-like flavoprotein
MLGSALAWSGLGTLEPGTGEPQYTDASHHMGTTRMADSPRRGVVDRDCRVHGVRNLYIASSAVFPSAGHANPTLTIVALALRLAEHLRRSAGP